MVYWILYIIYLMMALLAANPFAGFLLLCVSFYFLGKIVNRYVKAWHKLHNR